MKCHHDIAFDFYLKRLVGVIATNCKFLSPVHSKIGKSLFGDFLFSDYKEFSHAQLTIVPIINILYFVYK